MATAGTALLGVIGALSNLTGQLMLDAANAVLVQLPTSIAAYGQAAMNILKQ